MKKFLTSAEMKKIREHGARTRESMDTLHAKLSSPGQRYRTLMISSHSEAMKLGYGGSLDEWIAFVKRS